MAVREGIRRLARGMKRREGEGEEKTKDKLERNEKG